jgi:hypothetical protein
LEFIWLFAKVNVVRVNFRRASYSIEDAIPFMACELNNRIVPGMLSDLPHLAVIDRHGFLSVSSVIASLQFSFVDLGNVIEATSTGGRRSDFFTAEKLAPGNL